MTLQQAIHVASDPSGRDITILAAAHNALDAATAAGTEQAHLVRWYADDLWAYMQGLVR